MSEQLRGKIMTLREVIILVANNNTEDTVFSFTYEKDEPEAIPIFTFDFFFSGDGEFGNLTDSDESLTILDRLNEEEVVISLNEEVRVIEEEGAIIFSDNSVLTINKNVPAF